MYTYIHDTYTQRRYHTASVIERKMYIFGGQYYESAADLHFECDNIVSCLDVESMNWDTLQVFIIILILFMLWEGMPRR
jgi:hypothetical protein